jgi:hypothetical protein
MLKLISILFMESLEIAIVRLKEQETISEKPSQNLKACVTIRSSQWFENVESFTYYMLIANE